MPSFRDSLTKTEMEAVADFVARSAGQVPRRPRGEAGAPVQ
jgi:hypothetical protein